MKSIADRLIQTGRLEAFEYRSLIYGCDDQTLAYLQENAVRTAVEQFGHSIYVRGLIEISSYCRNNCLYCGLRRDNIHASRYRLTDSQILECCRKGYAAGLRTFVLQGGEDPAFDEKRLTGLIKIIKTEFPDAALTLSLGEMSTDVYTSLKQAGADRYLLRHEAADRSLYEKLHPSEMSWSNRRRCIADLKELGYQTGIGMMVGVPGQTVDSLVEDLMFMQEINPEMIGIGPFIPHKDTPLGAHPSGTIRQTLLLIAIIRLMFPKALIPSTTALATLSSDGRKAGILSGANVVMPNLSPCDVREKYEIYEGKASTGCEAYEGLRTLEEEIGKIGYKIDYSRGDYNDKV
jgi:biotin synthase